MSPLTVRVVGARQPVIHSRWTDVPPIIDGRFDDFDVWDSPQLELRPEDGFPVHAFVTILNDGGSLYMIIDTANPLDGDYTKEPEDHCYLAFHNPIDDVRFEIILYGEDRGLYRPVQGVEAASGFGPSPHSSRDHRIYEFKIPVEVVTFKTTGARWVHFASPETYVDSLPFDHNGGAVRANIWPLGAVPDDYDTWGILYLAFEAVGGTLVPTNNPLSELGNFSLVAAAVLCCAGAFFISWKRTSRHN